jgi:hypothetical protein
MLNLSNIIRADDNYTNNKLNSYPELNVTTTYKEKRKIKILVNDVKYTLAK